MSIQIDFAKLSDAELFDLNARLVEHIKTRHEIRSREAIAKFDIGDRVQFNDNQGRLLKATIIRINRKTVVLHSDDHKHWKVSPTFLQHIPSQKVQGKSKSNLFQFPS